MVAWHVLAVGLKHFSVVNFSLVCGLIDCVVDVAWVTDFLACIGASVVGSGSAFGVAWPL